MRSRYKVLEGYDCYFVTSTIIEWLPVFISDKYFDILLESLQFCRKAKQLQVFSYVFMPNHFHLIISHEDVSAVIRDLKSYTSKKIVELLKRDKKEWALHYMRDRAFSDGKGNEYKVWQDGFHPKAITSESMFFQKINYIHANPVRKGFVHNPEDWQYSSARQYRGEKVEDKFEIDLVAY